MGRIDRWLAGLQAQGDVRRGATLGIVFGLLLILLAFLACLLVIFIMHLR